MAPVNRVVRDGVTVGLIAYAAVAVFYVAFDVLAARRMLYTVDLLGKTFFRGLRHPAAPQPPSPPDLPAVFLYNGLHLLLSLCIGLTVVWLVERAEREPARAWLSLLAIVGGFFVTILGVMVLTAPIRPLLPHWSIVLANAYAVALAGAYLAWRRPGVWRTLLPFVKGARTRPR